MVKLLIENGADVNAVNKRSNYGDTALIWAAERGTNILFLTEICPIQFKYIVMSWTWPSDANRLTNYRIHVSENEKKKKK